MIKKVLLLNLCLIFCIISPVFSLTTFIPRLSISEETTDNLYLTNNNELKEFIIIPSADLELAITAPAKGLSLSYNPSYSFYNNFDENNTVRHGANLTAWTNLARNTRFELSDAFSKTEDPLEAEDSPFYEEEGPTAGPDGIIPETDHTIRRGRQPYYTNTARASLTYQFGQTDSVSIAYEYSTLENEDPTIEDNKRHSPSITLEYWPNRQWGTETEVTYEKGEFDTSDDLTNTIASLRLIRVISRHLETFIEYTHTITRYDGDSEDYNIYEPALGMTWAIDEDSSISFSAGYYVRDLADGDNETGWTLDGDINKRWTFQRSSFSLTGSSGYDQSYFGSENLGFSKFYQIAGSAGYEFTRHFRADLTGAYRHTDYEDLAEDRTDKEPSVTFGLNYQLADWLFSRLSYSYQSVSSTLDEDEYEENRVMLMMTFSPVQPYRL